MANGTSTPEITIYSTSTCMQCKLSRTRLEKAGLIEGIDFSYINAQENEEAAEFLASIDQRQVPYIVTPDETWSGLNVDKIDAAIAAHRARVAVAA